MHESRLKNKQILLCLQRIKVNGNDVLFDILENIYKNTNCLERYMNRPASFWNAFYEKNENKFFKDRHWLKVEFPELHQTTLKDVGGEDANIVIFIVLKKIIPINVDHMHQ